MSSPPPPFTIPAGQSLVYCYPSVFTASAGPGCSASNTAITSTNNQGFSFSIGGPYFTQTDFNTYVVPPILTGPGVTVHGIYPYIIFNGSVSSSNFIVHVGEIGGGGGGLVPGTSGTFNTSYFYNAGTTLSNIPLMASQVFSQGTLPIGVINDFMNTTFMAIAVYATVPNKPPAVTVRRGTY